MADHVAGLDAEVGRPIVTDETIERVFHRGAYRQEFSEISSAPAAGSQAGGDLCRVVSPDGAPLTRQIVQYRVLRAARRAKLPRDGVHLLRHSFCSHLAMRGAPVTAIQALAGHRELGVTQRYMHLTPAALESAIRLLDQAPCGSFRGDILETGAPRPIG